MVCDNRVCVNNRTDSEYVGGVWVSEDKGKKPKCPVCGQDIDSPVTEEQLEEAYAEEFFGEDN